MTNNNTKKYGYCLLADPVLEMLEDQTITQPQFCLYVRLLRSSLKSEDGGKTRRGRHLFAHLLERLNYKGPKRFWANMELLSEFGLIRYKKDGHRVDYAVLLFKETMNDWKRLGSG